VRDSPLLTRVYEMKYSDLIDHVCGDDLPKHVETFIVSIFQYMNIDQQKDFVEYYCAMNEISLCGSCDKPTLQDWDNPKDAGLCGECAEDLRPDLTDIAPNFKWSCLTCDELIDIKEYPDQHCGRCILLMTAG